MPQIIKKELQLAVSGGRTISLDIQFNSKVKSAIPILFCHGFKGFKDWGCNNLISSEFAKSNYFFIKFNFSLNGVIPDNLSDITDAEAFGQNNFSKELEDIKSLVNCLETPSGDLLEYKSFFGSEELVIMGHSRGASMALISAIEDSRIKKTICWAPVFDLSKYANLKVPIEWQSEPAAVVNGRTGETYPIYYQFYEDFVMHGERFDIESQIGKLDKPILLLHGTDDTVVDISHSKQMYELVGHSLFSQIEGAGHTFGASHPWTSD
jgi:uncharacterized protein